MGVYFQNEPLDNLWIRLVSATENITGNTISNGGLKEIFESLGNFYGIHPMADLQLTTPYEYLTHIAEIARYRYTGTTDGEKINLETIVNYLEQQPFSFELSDDLTLYCTGNYPEYVSLTIYKDDEWFNTYERTSIDFPLYLPGVPDSHWTTNTNVQFTYGKYVAVLNCDGVEVRTNEVWYGTAWTPEISAVYEDGNYFRVQWIDPGYMEAQPTWYCWSVEKTDGASPIFEACTSMGELYMGDWYDSLEPGEYILYVQADFDGYYENPTGYTTFYR